MKLLSWDTVLLSYTLFICPHREDVGHKQNADTPGEGNPYILRCRLSSQQCTDTFHYCRHWLVFGKGPDQRRH